MSEETKEPVATVEAPSRATPGDAPVAEAEAANEPKTSVQQSERTDETAAKSEPVDEAVQRSEPVDEAEQRSEPDDETPLDAAGRERPRFLLGFPEHPELQRLARAFEVGNYALVRAEAEALAERAESRAVRDAALELRRRIEPDPLAKYLLALTAGLLLSLAYWAYHH